MRIVECGWGHFYDADEHSSCPECRKEFSCLPPRSEPGPGPDTLPQYYPFQKISLPEETGGVEVVGMLGEGSTGQVYRVRQVKEYALKVIPWTNEKRRESARREFEMAGRLRGSRYVVPCFRCYEQDNATFIVQELAAPWFSWYASRACRVSDVLNGVLDTLNAIRDIHAAGLAHFDVKPGNMLVSDAGVRLGDFSHSLPVRIGDPYTGPRGTFLFMAPEAYGNTVYNGTEDLYSLGVTLYMLLTGSVPYGSAGNPSRPRREDDRIRTLFLREDLVRIVEKATAFRPEDRYRTPEEFGEAVRGFIAANPSLMDQEIPYYAASGRFPGGWDRSATLTVPTVCPAEADPFCDKS